MGWWKDRQDRKKQAETVTLVTAMATAFATALGGVLSAQSEQIKQQGAFLGTLQDLSARKAATVLGSRGGRTTAARKRQKQAIACPLCENPNRRGVTLEMLNFHRQHEPEPGRALGFTPQSNGNGDTTADG